MSNAVSNALPKPDTAKISVRLARDVREIEAAQRLRYQVFYEEFAAKPNNTVAAARLDMDDFDDYADHLIVIDHARGDMIVGTYRLLQQEQAKKCGQLFQR